MLHLSNQMSEQLSKNQSLIRNISKIAGISEHKAEEIISKAQGRELKSVEQILSKLLNELAKGSIDKSQVAKMLMQNDTMKPLTNVAAEAKVLLEVLEKTPELKIYADKLKAFLKPILNLNTNLSHENLALQIKNSGILLEASLRNEILPNKIPKTLKIVLEQMQDFLSSQGLKNLKNPSIKNILTAVNNMLSTQNIGKKSLESLHKGFYSSVISVKENLEKLPNNSLVKSLEKLDNLEKYIRNVIKNEKLELSPQKFQKIEKAIDKVVKDVLDSVNKQIESKSVAKANSDAVKMTENKDLKFLKITSENKIQAIPLQKATQESGKQDIKLQTSMTKTDILNTKQEHNNVKISNNTKKQNPNKEVVQKLQENIENKGLNVSSNKNYKTLRPELVRDLKDVKVSLHKNNSPVAQIAQQDVSVSTKDIKKEIEILKEINNLLNNIKEIKKHIKQEFFVQAKSKQSSEKNLITENTKAALSKINQKELSTEQIFKSHSKSIVETASRQKNTIKENINFQNTQTDNINFSQMAISQMQNIKIDSTLNLENQIKMITKKIENLLNLMDKSELISHKSLKEARGVLKSLEHISSNFKMENAKISDLSQSLQQDMKNTLLQLNDSASSSKSANANSIQNMTTRLINQIEMHQFISYVADTAHCYVPYMWDGMKGGYMAFKRGKKDKFYCNIDLNFQKLGRVNIMLGLYKKKYLDISISTELEDMNKRIKDNLKFLKLALGNVGLLTKQLNIIPMQNAEKTSLYEEWDKLDLGMSIKV